MVDYNKARNCGICAVSSKQASLPHGLILLLFQFSCVKTLAEHTNMLL